ncbi:cytochrome P450 [Melanogaster broomeanus]|nr:cytochrome P450 [Melanogaster broomeanus]
MATANWTTLSVAVLVCVIVFDVGRRRGKKQTSRFPHPLPPGPPPLPIVGNVRGINVNAPWLTYSEWSRVYEIGLTGDLVYSRLFNQDIIIINSEKVAKDLLEDRSSNYSDRPNVPTTALFGVDFNTVFLPYGDRWRLQSRFFHQSLKADCASRFVPMQQSKAHELLRRLLESPELYIDHLFQYGSSVIMNGVYDYDPLPTNDHVVDIIAKALKMITVVLTPEVTVILGAFPIILSIPSWFPGMGIKRKGALCREWAKEWVELPFEHALQRMNDGSTAPSMVFDALRKAEQEEAAPEWLQALKEAAATAFGAGSETSSGVLTTFLLAMVLHPEIQEKAHAQLEAVGPCRFVVSTDVINFTVVGATIITNLWSMAHDESKYSKPFEFIPERFLNPDGTLTSDDVLHIAFGFGRRICAGRHFADVTLWSAMSTILALFKLSVPKDEGGNEVSFEPQWTSGISTYPLPFPCSIVPRIPGMDANKLEELIDANAVLYYSCTSPSRLQSVPKSSRLIPSPKDASQWKETNFHTSSYAHDERQQEPNHSFVLQDHREGASIVNKTTVFIEVQGIVFFQHSTRKVGSVSQRYCGSPEAARDGCPGWIHRTW